MDIINLTKKLLQVEPPSYEAYNELTSQLYPDIELFAKPTNIHLFAQAWYALNEYLNMFWLSHAELSTIVACGEEIILCSFISKRIGSSIKTDELIDKIVNIAVASNPKMEILHDSSFYHLDRYFQYCFEFGADQARKNSATTSKISDK